jgi:hypothetical protein
MKISYIKGTRSVVNFNFLNNPCIANVEEKNTVVTTLFEPYQMIITTFMKPLLTSC